MSGVVVPPDYFGMHVQCVVAPCGDGVLYPYPSGLGFTTVRLWDTTPWAMLEPSRGVFDWSGLDSLVSQATASGVTSFVFTLGGVPAWASSNGSGECGTSTPGQCYPPDIRSMDGFLTTFVQRECGVVRYYEAWNEPNLSDFWRGSDAQLLTIFQHVYSIAKDPANCGCSGGACSPGGGANPNQVLTPSVNTISADSGRQWLANWLALVDKPGPKPDIVSFHGYESQPETVQQDVAWLRSLADAHGLKNAEIWDTEASWGKEQDAAEKTEASWLMRSYVLQAASGLSRFYWYAFGSCSWGALYGPSCGYPPDHQQGMREAGTAYSTMSKWLTGATIEGCSSDDEQTWSCTLTRPNGYKAVMLWNAGSTKQARVPDPVLVQYRDWQDTKSSLGTTVTVSPMPILLENESAF